MPRSITKTTLRPGYRLKILEWIARQNLRDPQYSKAIALIIENWVDEKIKSGEISPISEQDIAEDQNLSVESFLKGLKRKISD